MGPSVKKAPRGKARGSERAKATDRRGAGGGGRRGEQARERRARERRECAKTGGKRDDAHLLLREALVLLEHLLAHLGALGRHLRVHVTHAPARAAHNASRRHKWPGAGAHRRAMGRGQGSGGRGGEDVYSLRQAMCSRSRSIKATSGPCDNRAE
eukprot:3612864-Pleurochrysis_carterae.AAC.1